MELNLKTFNATEIIFEVTLPLSGTIVSKLQSCFIGKNTKTNQKDSPFIFGRDYTIDKQNHYERAVVFKASKSGNKYAIIISYSLESPLYGLLFDKERYKPMEKLFDCLTEIDKEIIFDVKAFFSYSDSKYTTTIVNLPIKLENNDYFDEIRGVRFTKSQDDKIAYSVTVDRPGNKNIFTNLFFQYVGKMDKELPKNIIKYSNEISRRVVNEK